MSDQQGVENEALQHLAAALGRVPSGLFIVTARSGDEETGMLASWVQQCSFDPPQVSLAIAPQRTLSAWLKPGAALTINILEVGQNELLSHFGKGFDPGEPAFKGLKIDRPNGAPPVLTDALAYLECKVVSRHPAGDHDLLIAQVVAGATLRTGHPRVHIRKNGLGY
jgi:flavin reductase (DIM6/NTAB) family NADH-FMN oxidoreductase RutF